MADNYLEKKMEAFREGRQVIRRQGTSVEGLLNVLAEDAAGKAEEPAAYAAGSVMPVQLEAIVRGASRLKESESFRFEVDEASAVIRILGPGSPRKYLIEAGELILAMRLKAAELHLRSSVSIRPESTAPANPLIATLSIWKSA